MDHLLLGVGQGFGLVPTARAGIVHLGLGAFFRTLGAIYVAEAGGWGVTGVSLQSPGTCDKLRPQGWAYTPLELAPDGEKPQVPLRRWKA